jgi:hypothetical protein
VSIVVGVRLAGGFEHELVTHGSVFRAEHDRNGLS